MRAETVIVGGGLAGSAAAWALARQGRPCVLLEALQPGHDRGSSHGSARIFRRAYPDRLYVRLTGEARQLWTELEDEAGQTLITVTGSLDFGPSSLPRDMYGLLKERGVQAEMVDPRDAAERWPGFAFGDDDAVMYHQDGGVIDAERAMAAMRRLAEANGAEIRDGTEAVITARGVHTHEGTYEADTIIVAAGAWTGPLVEDLVPLPELTVRQVSAFHFEPRTRTATWPTFIYHGDRTVYGLLSGADAPGQVKIGVHDMGTVTTGYDRDGIPDQAARDEARRFVMTKAPGLQSEPSKALTCLYTSTRNEDFILDRRGALVIVSACSGHGAKFAPLTGVFAANLAGGGGSPDPRFALGGQE